jgi:hypothetical protein
MVDMLKCDRHKLIGHLHELFWWGLDNADRHGVIGRVQTVDIADAAGWRLKDAERFVRALLECGGEGHPGFLEMTDVGYVLHDWYDYAGKLNDQRELRRESNRRAQSAYRQRLRKDDDADSKHPTVPERSVAKRSVPETPPLPPHDVSADALVTEAERRDWCCAMAKITNGQTHMASCSVVQVTA